MRGRARGLQAAGFWGLWRLRASLRELHVGAGPVPRPAGDEQRSAKHRGFLLTATKLVSGADGAATSP